MVEEIDKELNKMEKEELFRYLIGFFAYDTGCVDSGIKNDIKKEKVKNYLDKLSENDFRILLTQFIREHFVSEEAVAKGYGIEDVREFIEWLSDYMEIDI